MKISEKYLDKQHDLSNKKINPPFPKILKIDICNACNYACVFCPQAKQGEKVGCIEESLFYTVVSDAYKAGAREICLSATGEPLLNRNLEKYIPFSKDIGYEYIFFNTNGYLLTQDRTKNIIDAGVDSVKFSINAADENYNLIHGHDGYATVIRNLIFFDEYRKERSGKNGSNLCSLSVSCVATAVTQNEVEIVRSVTKPYVDDFFAMNANNGGLSERSRS